MRMDIKESECMRYWLRQRESEGKKLSTFLKFIFFMLNNNGSGKKKVEIASMKFNKNKTAKTWKLAELKVNIYSSHM